MCGMLNIKHNNSETNYWPEQNKQNTVCADSMETLMSYTEIYQVCVLQKRFKYLSFCVFVWSTCVHTDVCLYLRGLFATRRGGSAAGGGQRGWAGLWGTLLTGRGHLVQAILPGRVGLHAAGGRWVLKSKTQSFIAEDSNKKSQWFIQSFKWWRPQVEITRKSISLMFTYVDFLQVSLKTIIMCRYEHGHWFCLLKSLLLFILTIKKSLL